MEYVTLGRTGLRASVMGLGCGGPSRIGQRTGKSEAEQVSVIRQALDAGRKTNLVLAATGGSGANTSMVSGVGQELPVDGTWTTFTWYGGPGVFNEEGPFTFSAATAGSVMTSAIVKAM